MDSRQTTSDKQGKSYDALFANTSSDDEREDDDDEKPMMIDKVRAIHEYFDKDEDGFLNYWELRSLQAATSDDNSQLGPKQYELVCQALGCDPSKGVDIECLRLTYASGGGSDVHKDFDIIVRIQKAKLMAAKEQAKNLEEVNKEKNDDDDVIEVVAGEDIDISPNSC